MLRGRDREDRHGEEARHRVCQGTSTACEAGMRNRLFS